MAEAFEDLLLRLGRQHQLFMDELASTVVEGLKADNRRLADELADSRRVTEELEYLRSLVGKKAKMRPRPPIPELPSAFALTALSEWSDGPTTCTWAEPTSTWTTNDEPASRPWTEPANGVTLAEKGAFGSRVGSWQSLGRICPPGVIEGDEAFGGTSKSFNSIPELTQSDPVEPINSGVVRPTSAGIAEAAPEVRPSRRMSRVSLKRRQSTRSTKSSQGSAGSRESFINHMATLATRVDPKLTAKEKNRLRALLGLKAGEEVVTITALQELLRRRSGSDLDHHSLLVLFRELKRVMAKMPAAAEAWQVEERVPKNCIALNILTEFVVLTDLQDFVDPEHIPDLRMLIKALSVTTVEEIIESATKSAAVAIPKKYRFCCEGWLHGLVTILAVVNVATLGVSVDWRPGSVIWFIIDTVCAGVFVFEVLTKLSVYGLNAYFYTSEFWHWNTLDFLTTVISVLDWSITVFTRNANTTAVGGSGQVAATVRVVVVLRVLRLVRLIRVVVIQSEVVRDLAKMLVGFVLGLPSLFWVLFLFGFVLYGVGLTFRLMIGPAEGQNLRATCGDGDQLVDWNDPVCKIHYLYGEEFFGTVPQAMFTTFRFMLGDVFSRFGNSLTVAFSYGYGKWFEMIYVIFMIVVHFGFFNIITAIFVDSTTTGLKLNDETRKYAQQYERHYVRNKLRNLVRRITDLCTEMDAQSPSCLRTRVVRDEQFELSCEDFVIVMEDVGVRVLLQDLDVAIYRPELIFDIFDPEGDGVVTANNLVKAVMKLRGGAQKNDLVAAGIAVRSLHDKVDRLQLQLFESQTRLEANQAKLLEMMPTVHDMMPAVQPLSPASSLALAAMVRQR